MPEWSTSEVRSTWGSVTTRKGCEVPRAHLVQTVPEVPLTVTAVSARLGVSPSTLRTWERRYGLGPGERRAGSHRRYQPEDIARLGRMVSLIRSGVAPADAAASVLALPDEALLTPGPETLAPTGAADIVAASREGSAETLQRMLEVAVSTDGLVHTWSELVEPALETLFGSEDGEQPGRAPSAVLTTVILTILQAVAEQFPQTDHSLARPVVVLTDQEHRLAAYVASVALVWNGVPTSVLATGRYCGAGGADRFEAHRRNHDVRIAVIMGSGTSCERLLGTIAREQDVDVVLVGADAPTFLDRHVQRVRTLTACVDETIALARTPVGDGSAPGEPAQGSAAEAPAAAVGARDTSGA